MYFCHSSLPPSLTLTPLCLFHLQPVGGNTSSPLSLGEAVRCTAASLDHGGLYLVHGPLVLLLWVGHNIANTSLVQLFNITCLSTLPSGEVREGGGKKGGWVREKVRGETVRECEG